MKRIATILLLISTLFLLCACGREPGGTTGKTEGKLPDKITAAYATLGEDMKYLKTLPDPMKLDFTTKEYHATYYLGLSAEDAKKEIKEAYVSCAEIQPSTYECAIVRTADGVSGEDLLRRMLDGNDLYKWICTGAQNAGGVVCGDVVLMVTGSNEQIGAVCNAFAAQNEGTGKMIFKK